MKSKKYLLIGLASLAAAVALVAIGTPLAMANDGKPESCNAQTCELKPWKEYRTENQPAEFTADWVEAERKCNKDQACMDAELEAKGWK